MKRIVLLVMIMGMALVTLQSSSPVKTEKSTTIQSFKFTDLNMKSDVLAKAKALPSCTNWAYNCEQRAVCRVCFYEVGMGVVGMQECSACPAWQNCPPCGVGNS